MKSNLLKSLKLTLAFCVFFSVFYIFILWVFAKVAGPNGGNADVVTLNGAGVPAEMVTSSGSGLDPEISKMGAYVQIKRVAAARGLSEEQVKAIVDEQVKGPFLGLFGPGDRVNVLKLNVALDEARKTAENR